MKTNPRHLEQQLAWRSLMMVVLPALVVLPLLALSHHAPTRAAAQAPLFTMASEPPARAMAAQPQPIEPAFAPPNPQLEPCIIPPTPQALQPVARSFDPFPPDDSDLTVTNLPKPRQPRAATPQIVPSTSYLVHSPRPPYPSAMRKRRITGSVGVRIAVSPQGLPTAVDITRPSGHSEFDTTTRSWILRHWRFQPATSGGRAIASSVTTTVHFRLR